MCHSLSSGKMMHLVAGCRDNYLMDITLWLLWRITDFYHRDVYLCTWSTVYLVGIEKEIGIVVYAHKHICEKREAD